MKLYLASIGLLLASAILGFTVNALAKAPPVAKLAQVVGSVEYSRSGATWRPVRRTKYLFVGYQIKTGADGGAKLINQQTGMVRDLGANSQISITDTDAVVVAGNLSVGKSESANIFQGLSNKFSKAQRYTTVRRSGTQVDDLACDSKVRTVRKLTLSPSFPDLVWRNACPEFSYRLSIDDGAAIEIAASSNAEMIRFSVKDLSLGMHTYKVEVLDNDGIVYSPRKESAFAWISGADEKKILSTIEGFGDDVFLASDFLESQLMFVAAMDQYRAYFDDHPDDNDMRPLLIKAYQELKLSNLRENEARLYNASIQAYAE